MGNQARKMELKEKKLFARGKRGIVSTAFLDGENGIKVAVKEKRFSSKAEFAIEKEAQWLKILNKHNIGPKFISFEHNSLIYRFVEGQYLPDFLEKANRIDAINVLKKVMQQCRKMDELGINKLEMTRPRRHVVVSKNGKRLVVTMIDFERCRRTEKPKNVTQFCQFISSTEMNDLLADKKLSISREKIIQYSQNYKRRPNAANLKKIMAMLK